MGAEKQAGFIIRRMAESDVQGVAQVESASFTAPWSESVFAEELGNPLARYLVVQEQGSIVGYAGFWLVLGEAQVTNIALLPHLRGRKLGQRLVEALIAQASAQGADSMILEVRHSNKVAQKLYEKMGFKILGLRVGYYQDNGEDALLMQKDLVKEDG